MWQFAINRAMVFFAQATGGAPVSGAEDIPVAAQAAATQPPHTIGHTILLFIYFLVCLSLVVAVLLQTTKQEGLSGAIGGSTQSVFKGKKGFEERLQMMTNYLAVAFIVMSILVTFLAFRLPR